MAKNINKSNKELLLEAYKISYRLRSTFFYRKLHEYKTLEFPKTITQLLPHSKHYNWEAFNDWGISISAFNVIKNSNLDFIQVFSHPKLLREHPHLIGYYRNVSVLSQKATIYMCKVETKKYEEGKTTNIAESNAMCLAILFNEHISLIIDNAFGEFQESEIHGLLFASTGAQIDGSWRNSIGEEAEKVVQTLITQEVIKRNLLQAFIMRASGNIETSDIAAIESIISNIKDVKGLMLTNQKSILFSSEPDLTIVDKGGKSIMVIEVKGGIDPAGALERYGAAKKSFEHSLRENNEVKTCLIISCITSEVEHRIMSDNTITAHYNLTNILTNEDHKKVVLNYIMEFVLNE